ncbi:MAG: hypothetical protein COB67_00420 [SAR324 cluster bacterium]|uniref:Uncharacterized protein n=1 Tax=SAR324 cluster bacterium TaxID=2024889 RepID=A0A2A4TBQ2_9DELT|nr:MAG: hypothetical protein COB67_00420 [SAR324 cluster bacterium]
MSPQAVTKIELKACLLEKDNGIFFDREKLQILLEKKGSWNMTQRLINYAAIKLLNIYWSDRTLTQHFYKESIKEIFFLMFMSYNAHCKVHSRFQFDDFEKIIMQLDKLIYLDNYDTGINLKQNLYEPQELVLSRKDNLESSLLKLTNIFDDFIFYQAHGGGISSFVVRIAMLDRWVRMRTQPMVKLTNTFIALAQSFRVLGGRSSEIEEKWVEAAQLSKLIK